MESEISSLVAQLIEIGRKWPADPCSSSHFLDNAHHRTVELGERLNELGEFDAMFRAHKRVSEILGGPSARELELAWDGIGDWQG